MGLITSEDNWSSAKIRAVRVISVKPDSPAEIVGLEPMNDYIMGTECCIFDGIKGFLKYIANHKNSVLRLRVYNSRLYDVREVKVKSMDSNWGCKIACGRDHMIPDILPGKMVKSRKSVAVEISNGYAGIIMASAENSGSNPGDVISISDMDITLGEPVSSIYEEKAKEIPSIIPKNTQATSVAELDSFP